MKINERRNDHLVMFWLELETDGQRMTFAINHLRGMGKAELMQFTADVTIAAGIEGAQKLIRVCRDALANPTDWQGAY